MIFCFWWIWEKVDVHQAQLQCTCDEIIFQQSPKIITHVKWKMYSGNYKLTKCFPHNDLSTTTFENIVICHFWILKVTTAHHVFRLFLVLAMHWSSKCIGEAERDVPSYASTFGRSVIYAIMHSALCTPSLPPQSPIFAIMHGKPGLFTSCQFLPRIPLASKQSGANCIRRLEILTKK